MEHGSPENPHAVAQIRGIRQEDNAPQVQRRLLRPAYSVSDMKEGLEGARHESLAVFFNHPRPSQEIDGLLGIADENFLKDESFLRCDPSECRGSHPPGNLTDRTAWLMSQSDPNPSQLSDSLLTGKITGNFADFGPTARFSRPVSQ